MSKNRQIPLLTAQAVAQKLVAELSPVCDRIEVVGSIRRGKSLVRDIDVVLVPRPSALELLTMNSRSLESVIDGLVARGSLTPVRSGEKVKSLVATKTGIPVDIYVATEESWATLLLIRTGSKEHNVRLAQKARELGMKLRASGDGIENPAGELIKIQNEEDVFRLLGLDYLSPEMRD